VGIPDSGEEQRREPSFPLEAGRDSGHSELGVDLLVDGLDVVGIAGSHVFQERAQVLRHDTSVPGLCAEEVGAEKRLVLRYTVRREL
jgi:hypothetical protein